jgi:predicted amino acid-binding ACT domain protein
LGLVGVIGNGFVIVVIAFYTTMHQQLANVFVVNQSAIDGLSSLIMIAMLASGSDSGWYTPSLVEGQFGSELYCRVWQSGFLQWSFFTSSTYNLVVLALERYVKIVYPVVYKTSFTKFKVRILLAFCLACWARLHGFVWNSNNYCFWHLVSCGDGLEQ